MAPGKPRTPSGSLMGGGEFQPVTGRVTAWSARGPGFHSTRVSQDRDSLPRCLLLRAKGGGPDHPSQIDFPET